MAVTCRTIGDAMKVYRGKNGLTQRQLGELLAGTQAFRKIREAAGNGGGRSC